jgi:hypothetical protein
MTLPPVGVKTEFPVIGGSTDSYVPVDDPYQIGLCQRSREDMRRRRLSPPLRHAAFRVSPVNDALRTAAVEFVQGSVGGLGEVRDKLAEGWAGGLPVTRQPSEPPIRVLNGFS